MIPENILNEISQRVGSSPLPYQVQLGQNWENVDTDGVYWELPPVSEEDKTIEKRYEELLIKASKLAANNLLDPNIKPIEDQIKLLLPDVKLFKKNGLEIYTKTDLRLLDKNRGIRKEWYEISSKYKGLGISFYLGFMRDGKLGEVGVDRLIAMPSSDQYDFLRISQTRTYISKNATEAIINQLEKLNQEYGLSVLFASQTTLDFVLEKPIEKENFSKIRSRILRMCPDAEELSTQLHLGVVYLWWD